MAGHERVKREKGMRRDAMRRMWRLLFVDFLCLMVNVALFHDLVGAFLRSLVACEMPLPHSASATPGSGWECVKGASYDDSSGQCWAEPPGSRYWSQSAKCASKAYVMNRSVTLHAELGVAGHIASILAIIFLGPLVDSWGRKPIMLLGLLGAFARNVLYVSVEGADSGSQLPLLMAGAVISHLTNAFSTAVNAMVSDLSRPDVQGRGAAFATKGMVQNVATLCGFSLGYMVLKLHLTSYRAVMGGCAAVSLLAFLIAAAVLKDTVADSRTESYELDEDSANSDEEYEPLQLDGAAVFLSSDEEELESSGGIVACCLHSADQVLGTFVIFWQEKFLRQFIGLSLLLAMAYPAHAMAHLLLMNQLDYSPEASSLTGVLHPIFGAMGAFLASSLSHRWGSYATFGGALLCEAMALTLLGLCGPFADSLGDVLFWSATAALGISGGVSHAMGHALVSVRVGDDVQGRLFAFLHIVALFGSTVGEAIASAYLYDADWTGWAAGATFFSAAALVCLGALWLAVAYYRVVRPARKRMSFAHLDDVE
eukprot:TRINITY_DN5783_c0_g1_i1.p1 TRINITY_DN5783_c0_g1~~TRINITY_DN5783_c0_g1_i1.p1  ORF type:complete len:540 (-),score=131.70 TRINITY_DN5783_c0_g1_i1:18-1637(-)